MIDVVEILGIIVVSSTLLGALPLLLLYILRRSDAERKRLDELQVRIERLEAAVDISAMSSNVR